MVLDLVNNNNPGPKKNIFAIHKYNNIQCNKSLNIIFKTNLLKVYALSFVLWKITMHCQLCFYSFLKTFFFFNSFIHFILFFVICDHWIRIKSIWFRPICVSAIPIHWQDCFILSIVGTFHKLILLLSRLKDIFYPLNLPLTENLFTL